MSGISSGIGLVSGLPTQSIIDQLISLDSRPLLLLQQRAETLQIQRTAFAELSARLLGLRSTIARFDEPSFFRGARATSSDDNVLSATASEGAAQGTFQFQVQSLVTNEQLISRGFANTDSQPIGAGTISFEIGNGRLDNATSLQSLNGGNGVRRGVIEITDRAGDSASVDLTTAITVKDVIDEINSRTEINVRARADGDRIVIEDNNDPADPNLQNLSIRDLAGGFSALDLGIAQQGQDGRITGTQIYYLTNDSRLTSLNDGNGVRVGRNNSDIAITVGDRVFTAGLRGLLQNGRFDQQARRTYLDVLNSGNGVREGTFKITNRAGVSAEIEVDESVKTVGDVIALINNAGIDITATVDPSVGRINISDDSTPATEDEAGNLVIEDISGNAATDLGLVMDTEEDDFQGNVIYRIDTLGDVIRAINYAQDESFLQNDLVAASINDAGDGLKLFSAEAYSVGVSDNAVASSAAIDLGLVGESNAGLFESRPLVAGLNTRLLTTLNGGSGVSVGGVFIDVQYDDGDFREGNIDFTGVTSVQGIIDRFNEQTDSTNISASLNNAGNGILFTDESGRSGTIVLKDQGQGRVVRDLFGLSDGETSVTSNDGSLATGNLQLQYISEATDRDTLGNGRGVSNGSFRITTSDGQSANVLITDTQTTVGDIIAQINGAPISGIEARINQNGDGIEIIDTTGGSGTFKIETGGNSTTAGDLNFLGSSEVSEDAEGNPISTIDGSFEYTVDIDADDTLDEVRNKINNLGIDVRANIINDGSGENAYRIIINSEVSGSAGRLNIDTGDTGLTFNTLVRAQDAVVFFGSESPFVITSTTNTLTEVIENVSIELTGTSDSPVELSISPDFEGLVNNISAFVSSYNETLDRIDEFTSFDTETNARGPLFGDNAVDAVKNRLRSAINASVEGQPIGFERLTFVGVRVGAGGRLSFDENTFRDRYAENPEAIETLFTTEETGIGVLLDQVIDEITRGTDGLIAGRDALLERREDLITDRTESLQELLARKRARLERRFAGLESTLANLQGAQNSLATLAGIAAR